MDEVKKEEVKEKEEEIKEDKKEVNCEELLAQKEQELKEWKERALRYAAEVENLKKSFKREKEEYYKFALEAVFKELLPSIDNLERAIEAFKESENLSALKQGVELSLKVMLQTLEKFGLKQFEPAIGEPFHPEFHEALSTEEREDIPDGGIAKVYQKGYKLHERIIRPALVGVATGKKVTKTEEKVNNQTDLKESAS